MVEKLFREVAGEIMMRRRVAAHRGRVEKHSLWREMPKNKARYGHQHRDVNPQALPLCPEPVNGRIPEPDSCQRINRTLRLPFSTQPTKAGVLPAWRSAAIAASASFARTMITIPMPMLNTRYISSRSTRPSR